MVMCANQSGFKFGVLAGRYPGRFGHLFAPGATRGPFPDAPYALDNGAWPAYVNGREWQEAPWRKHLDWAASKKQGPLWVVVPDVVGQREQTIERWWRYAPVVREYGFRPAFAAQDFMTFEDVPDSECMVCIGGTTPWKLAAIQPWSAKFPGRTHILRVSGPDRLDLAYEAGAVSVDGTGWFHNEQYRQLRAFFERTQGEARRAA
jgi:hypothetical protein